MRAAAKSHTGKRREINEDCVYVALDAGLLILADGMGGHQGGEVASRLAVDYIASFLGTFLAAGASSLEDSIRESIAGADRAILARAAQDSGLKGMGTTLVLSVCRADSFYLAHVGDSRAYLLRDGSFRLLTDDHTLVGHMLRTGELSPRQARDFGMRNMLVRSVGNSNTPVADIQTVAWNAGDCLMLCSDGLTGMVPDADIRRVLASPLRLEDKCDRLITLANRRGGKDNISVIVASPN